MPFYKKPRNFIPLLKAAEKKSIKNGLRHAIFTSRFDRYVGEWKKDLKEGKGTFLTIDGKLYEGDWYKGYRHGFGLLSHLNTNGTYTLEYRGDWVRGKPEGIGWWYYENGDVFLGFWKAGKRHGFGTMWYTDNTVYVGYFSEGKKQGLGLLVLENGNRYEGHWENDLKHGFGRFYHIHTGQLQQGCWVEGICVKSKMSDILIRQFCDRPTQYPIPPNELKFSKAILEHNEFWLQQKAGDIDKNLKFCIDQM
ncbi:MORN repeat-containing protein 3-like [Trichoplusia ni]|uniref:MORN repeat-containing protein 3 n=1 Tax=Trichoplusia ni TaxID=7111 RepID=A0A7E5V8X5_TRINI|nr:MORN repeat-containing protein 3-like [Trichoplusia ni]